jgi:YesN/AraC family two-component response regulator
MLNNKILIIDDDPLIISSMHRSLMLEETDYEISSANDGKTGLELYHREKPILILLDLHMPVMGGIEFLKSISLSPTDPCAVIVLTGHSDDSHIKKCFDLGVSAFLRKPFNMYEFFGLVKQVISFKKIQHVLKEQCKDHITAKQFSEEKHKLLSAIMHKIKKPLIPIVNCTRDLIEGKIDSEDARINKLKEIQDASTELVNVFENPYDIAD